MTGVLLVAIYVLALGWFLGLDILGKIPPTLYAMILAGLGVLAAVGMVGALYLLGDEIPSRTEGGLPGVALVLAGAAAGGGLVALGRLLGAFRRGRGKA